MIRKNFVGKIFGISLFCRMFTSVFVKEEKNKPFVLEKRPSVDILYLGKAAQISSKNDAAGWTNYHQMVYDDYINDQLINPKYVDIRDEYGQSLIWWACNKCNMRAVQKLHKMGANIKQTDDQKRNLMHAASTGESARCADVIGYLYENGVDPNHKDITGNTVFDDLGHEYNVINWSTSILNENKKTALNHLNDLIKTNKK